MAEFDPVWAVNGPVRAPIASELDQGFPCGPADRDLFNYLFQDVHQAINALKARNGDADIPVDGWQSAPPASPAEGYRYIVKAPGSGAWSGQDNKIAMYLGGQWTFANPVVGLQANFLRGGRFVVIWYNASTWQETAVTTELGWIKGANIPVNGWQTAPPASPTEGDRYIIKSPATGEWAGRGHNIALYEEGAWKYRSPYVGMTASYLENLRYKEIWFNANVWQLTGQFQINANIPVKAHQSAPPGSPVEGDRYLVKASGTGSWLGKDNQVAVYQTGAWVFEPVVTGQVVQYVNGGTLEAIWWNGSAWIRVDVAKGFAMWGSVTSFASGTATRLTFPSQYKSGLATATLVDNAAGTVTISLADAGLYHLAAGGNTDASSYLEEITIRKNSVLIANQAWEMGSAADFANNGKSVSRTIYLAAGDVVDTTYRFIRTTGGSAAMSGGDTTFLSGFRIGA